MTGGETRNSPWLCLKQDVARYGGWSAFLREQSLWAVLWYRIGCQLDRTKPAALRRIVLSPWWVGFRFIEMLTGVSLPVGAQIGGGLRIWHFGGVFINSGTTIGQNCTLRQGVTVGNRSPDGGAPVIGNEVELGAYAQVLGNVTVGDGVSIGAMSLVITDVPAYHVAVGIPAKCKLRKKAPADNANAFEPETN